MAESQAGLERLAPFVLGRARRGVVGSSRYAQRLRTAVLEAARNPQRQPVLISGEPGLEKDNLAALVHYGSAERRRLLVRLDAGDLQGSALNLLNELGSSTLLVSGMDRIDVKLEVSHSEMSWLKFLALRNLRGCVSALRHFSELATAHHRHQTQRNTHMAPISVTLEVSHVEMSWLKL